MIQKFDLGTLVITAAASEVLNSEDVSSAVRRHMSGDWGDLCAEDKMANNAGLVAGKEDRLMSSYKDRNDVTFWIITEWDRSVTTVLLPEDY